MSRRFQTLRAFLFLTGLTLALCGTASAEFKVLAVQSFRAAPYESALDGFETACPCRIDRFILSERKGEDLMGAIRRIRPDAVLAVGREGLAAAAEVSRIPVFYVMTLAPPPEAADRQNLYGVSMIVSPEAQLGILSSALPDRRRIGLLYDPDRTGAFVAMARTVAAGEGGALTATPVSAAAGVPGALKEMIGDIDAFWLLPDLTVVTTETLHHIFLACLTAGVPVIAFSEKYLEMGAFMAIHFDPWDMGAQVGELTVSVLQGADPPPEARRRYARRPVATINPTIARKLGIDINANALETPEARTPNAAKEDPS